MSRLSVVQVGAGAIAQSWLEAVRTSDDTQLVGVVDVEEAVAAAAAEPFGARHGTDLEALLDEVEADLVIIATPPVTHRDLAVAVLDRDVSVLCEKPLAIDRESAAKMIAAAAASGGVLTMASKFRFVDALRRTRSMIASGTLGDVIWMRNTFTAPVDMAGRWNSQRSISGGGVLIDNGTHSVDICRYLLGPIVAVHAVEAPRVQGLDVEDSVQLWVRSATGAQATVMLSWAMTTHGDCFVEVDGTDGNVCVGWQQSRLRTATAPHWVDFSTPYDKHDAFRRNLADVVGAVRGEHAPLVGPDDAMASVAVIEAAYDSIRSGGWVDVVD